MGIHRVDNCIFTDLPAQYYEQGEMRDAIEYTVDFGSYGILFRLPYDAIHWKTRDKFFSSNKHIFRGLIFNNDWFENQELLITIDRLKGLLSQKTYPKTPKEKADLLFQFYLGGQTEDGQNIDINGMEFEEWGWKKLFFKSQDEAIFYTKYLQDQNLISATIIASESGPGWIFDLNITIEGLNYGIKIQTEGEKSNLCFIAMSFSQDTINIRNAIKEALWETGFEPILIDEQNINSDRTINDEIIANLKKCKFCIADFSYHSNGVYFESGFALGQNKKVIYTCLKAEFEKAHFDIRPLQHIIYPTAEQLKKDLINKIEAWIK